MKTAFRILCVLLALSAACLCSGCGQKAERRDRRAILEEMVVDYGSYGHEADEHIQALLNELRSVDADAAERWNGIMALWDSVNTDLTVHEGVLPDGLPDTDPARRNIPRRGSSAPAVGRRRRTRAPPKPERWRHG